MGNNGKLQENTRQIIGQINLESIASYVCCCEYSEGSEEDMKNKGTTTVKHDVKYNGIAYRRIREIIWWCWANCKLI
jgi:hypothetical protein